MKLNEIVHSVTYNKELEKNIIKIRLEPSLQDLNTIVERTLSNSHLRQRALNALKDVRGGMRQQPDLPIEAALKEVTDGLYKSAVMMEKESTNRETIAQYKKLAMYMKGLVEFVMKHVRYETRIEDRPPPPERKGRTPRRRKKVATL